MDRVVSHAELKELLGAYSLHALEDDEMALVDEHLATCEACNAELAELFDVAAALGTVVEAPVPTAIWDRIAAEVRAGAAASSSGASASAASTSAAVSASSEPSSSSSRPPTLTAVPDHVAPVIALDAAREAKRFRMRGIRIAVGSAAAAAAIVIPLTAALTGSGTPSLAALGARAEREPGAVTMALKDPEGHQVASAVMTASGKGYILRDSLPALPAGKTYQLWAITGETVSAGVLGRDPGVSAFTVDAPATALAITVEPTEGSVVATTKPLAVGTVE